MRALGNLRLNSKYWRLLEPLLAGCRTMLVAITIASTEFGLRLRPRAPGWGRHRYFRGVLCARLRSLTPGPPPFSSTNSTPADSRIASDLGQTLLGRNLTLGRSPFVNSIPAVSNACTSAKIGGALADTIPGFASRRFTVANDTDRCLGQLPLIPLQQRSDRRAR
jgi:hypothetical protein